MRITRIVIFLLVAATTQATAQTVQWASRVISCSVNGGVGDYSAAQVLGRPNVLPASYHARCAWVVADPDNQGGFRKPNRAENITVGFAAMMRVGQVAVAESFSPGTVEKITLIDSAGDGHIVYEEAPRPVMATGRMLNVYFALTEYKVKALRLDLRPDKVEGWHEIDAIGISDGADPIKATIHLATRFAWTGKPERLNGTINTQYSDFLPVISPDGKTLYFCRNNDPRNVGGQTESGNADIWYSGRQPDGSWNKAQNIAAPLNNNAANAIFSVTPDGNTVLVKGRYHNDGSFAGKGLSLSHRIAAGWSVPEPLDIINFYNKNDYSEAYLWHDATTLLLSVERDSGYGNKDLYVSFFRHADGKWTEPLNLGPTVNSAGNDACPFLAADGTTLFYASDGISGYGEKDLFVARRLDSSWTEWSEPENLGPVVNTPGDNSYFSIAAAGDYAYYTAEEIGSDNTDIMRIALPAEVKPQPVVLVSGTVVDGRTHRPLDAVIRYEYLPSGIVAGNARTTPASGAYKIVLPAGLNFGFRAEAQGYYAVSENLNTEGLDRYTEIHRDLVMQPIVVGQSIRLNNIFFEFGEAALKPESFPELDRAVRFMNDNPTIAIEIGGHTDNIGTHSANLALSMMRAGSVADYLVAKGIDRSRITSRGYGESKPVADNESADGRQSNRRVEFTIMK